jgi:hypothetical protein
MAKYSEWKQSSLDYRDFRHSDRPEDWEDTPHKSKARKGCKRSKSGEHDYGKLFKRYNSAWFPYKIMECTHCHKHKWYYLPV